MLSVLSVRVCRMYNVGVCVCGVCACVVCVRVRVASLTRRVLQFGYSDLQSIENLHL